MKRWQAILVTIALWAGPVVDIWLPFMPPEAKPYIIAALATINLLVAKKTSETNPDGTPAQVPWERPK